MLTDVGLPGPFINVTFSGLLWGYEDELPCLKLRTPKGCDKGNSPFGGDSNDWGDDGDEWDFKRKKRSLDDKEDKIVEKRGKKLR